MVILRSPRCETSHDVIQTQWDKYNHGRHFGCRWGHQAVARPHSLVSFSQGLALSGSQFRKKKSHERAISITTPPCWVQKNMFPSATCQNICCQSRLPGWTQDCWEDPRQYSLWRTISYQRISAEIHWLCWTVWYSPSTGPGGKPDLSSTVDMSFPSTVKFSKQDTSPAKIVFLLQLLWGPYLVRRSSFTRTPWCWSGLWRFFYMGIFRKRIFLNKSSP